MYCTKCGAQNPDNAVRCSQCGNLLTGDQAAPFSAPRVGIKAPGSADDPLFQSMIAKITGDMKFVGVVSIIYGIIICFGIIYALIGVPIIFMGIRLREGAEALRAYAATKNFSELYLGLERAGRCFYIQKVLFIVGFVLMGIGLIMVFIFLATGSSTY